MSLTLRVLIGLFAGLAVGVAVSLLESPTLARFPDLVEPVGTVFINAIRMTVIPLVTASLLVGVASAADGRSIGRLGGRGLALFVVMVGAAATFAAVVAAPVMARLPLDPRVVVSLRESAQMASAATAETARSVPSFTDWLVDLVPVNPIASAAEGRMLPLIIFTVAFALALGGLETEARRQVLGVVDGIRRASLILVHWILELAPAGVFALAVPLAARMGVAAVGTLVSYVALGAALIVVFAAAVLYPAAALGGGIGFARFARAIAPAQAVALSARSSLAALPAMIDGARQLGLPPGISSFLVPLAASVFRVGSAIGQTVGVLFAARLYGATPDLAQLSTIVLTVVITTFSIPGVPAGSIVAMVPILLAADLPVEGIGVLLGVDTIPDMFRTAANVTGGMSVAAILGRIEGRPGGVLPEKEA